MYGLKTRPVPTVPRGLRMSHDRVVVSLNHCRGLFPNYVTGENIGGIVHEAYTHRFVLLRRQ